MTDPHSPFSPAVAALAALLILVAGQGGAQDGAPVTQPPDDKPATPTTITTTSATSASSFSPSDPIDVAVADYPPFAMQTQDGAWTGAALDLWRLAAEEMGASYRLTPLEGDAAQALLGGADLVIPVTATPDLSRQADLTQPIYTARIGVAAPRPSRLMAVVTGFVSWQFLRLILGLSALLLMVGALIWAIERRGNSEQFNERPIRGLGDGFWWAGVTLTTIGYGDKAPRTALGRGIAMLWMLVGLAVSAALTAAVVNLSGVDGRTDLPESLEGRMVGVVEGSTTQRFLAREDVTMRSYSDVGAALKALDEGALDSVAAAEPALRHAIDASGTLELRIASTRLDPHYVGFATPEGSPLRERLDEILLTRLTSESGWDLLNRYLPQGD
ncbi:ion channel [Mesobaculum littorinae]|nr:transporter substrate-binding domain-containing protein [Mesobaculum littorinae]